MAYSEMGVEIERKFLVKDESWRKGATGIPYVQGYISRARGRTVRVRIAGSQAFLTVKGAVKNLSRPEFEYPVPMAEAKELLTLCEGPIIEKIRHHIPLGNHVWEVDEFLGENAGLVIAEVELSSPEEKMIAPPWLGREVTGDPRYYNSNLTIHPYSEWSREAPDPTS